MDFWVELSALTNVFYALVTLITLVVLTLQTNTIRRSNRAQFLYYLTQEATQHLRFCYELSKRETGSTISNLEERCRDTLYFFERLKTLADLKVLGVPTLDAVFGYQVLLVTNDLLVQERVLLNHPFPEVVALHSQLTHRWQSRRLPIPGATSDLRDRNPDFYQKNLAIYRAKGWRR